MELVEAIRQRYSCRSYLDKPIEKQKLEMVTEAARLAPSAKNLQDWWFVVVTDANTKNQLAQT
jgi:nitroreductase